MNITHTEDQVPQDALHQPPKYTTRVTKVRAGVIEGICFEGHDDGCLQVVLRVNGNLVVTLQ